MDNVRINVNYSKDNQDAYIDFDDIYVNRTGDWDNDLARLIHNTCELLFIEEGEVEYEISGQRYLAGARSLLIIGATEVHSYRIQKAPYIRYGLYLMPRYLASLPMIRDCLDVYATQSPEEMRHLCGLPKGDFEKLCQIVQRIHQEQQSGLEDAAEMCKALIWEITILLRRWLRKKRASSYSQDLYSSMLNVRSYIDIHFAEDCSLKHLSREFFIQPATISRNFSHCFDTTVSNYIMLVRISAAAQLLEQTGESVTEIAHQVGYNNINTFIRAFTKVMQISPLQYRKRHNESHRRRVHYDVDPDLRLD